MTAVEFILEKMQSGKWEYTTWAEREQIFEQAKEMEKQQSYSEEEVLEIIRQYALEEHLITSSKTDIWFEQFKKK